MSALRGYWVHGYVPWTYRRSHAYHVFGVCSQLLGGALGIFLQGILYCQVSLIRISLDIFDHWSQFMRYAIHFKSDGLGIKIGVFVLFLTTTLKTMHSLSVFSSNITRVNSKSHSILVWNIFIDYFADLEGAIALSYTSWWESASSLIVRCLKLVVSADRSEFLLKNATLDLYVQVFFVRRLFLISNRNWYVTAVVAFILAFSYAAMCVAVSGFHWMFFCFKVLTWFKIYYIIEGATAASIVAPWCRFTPFSELE